MTIQCEMTPSTKGFRVKTLEREIVFNMCSSNSHEPFDFTYAANKEDVLKNFSINSFDGNGILRLHTLHSQD